jgi:hypothetical protein
MRQAAGSKRIEPQVALRVVADWVGPGDHNSLETEISKGEQVRTSRIAISFAAALLGERKPERAIGL